MRRTKIITVVSILVLIVILLVYQYVFSIYEIIYRVEPPGLYSDSKSTVTIRSVPLNSFGKPAPLRRAAAEYKISEGADLVSIVSRNPDKGLFILRAKDKPGTVTIVASSPKSLLPSLIEIKIYSTLARNNF